LLVFDRFSQPPLPAYILAGILVGVFYQPEVIEVIRIGIAFLVFIFGLKMETDRISSVASDSLRTALITTVLIGLLLYTISVTLGLEPVAALYYSGAAAISSSLVGLKLVEQELRVDIVHGRLAESIHLIQDTIAILFIIIMSSLVSSAHPGETILLGTGIILAGLLFRETVFDSIADRFHRSRELTMLFGLTALTVGAAASLEAGLPIAVGAFSAGLAMAKFPHNMEIIESVGPIKDLFSALFFFSLGILVSVPTLQVLIFTSLLIFSTVVLKPAFTSLYLIELGYSPRSAYLAGLSLDQIGEFALILSIGGLTSGALPQPVFEAIVISSALTMIFSSYSERYDERIYRLTDSLIKLRPRRKQLEEEVDELEDHIIFVGYDTVGKEIAENLREIEQEFVVIENDPEKLREENIKNYVYGDAMEIETWEKAKVREATAVFSTVPVMNVSKKILEFGFDADIFLNAEEIYEAAELMDEGAYFVEVSDILGAEELAEHVKGVSENPSYREELRRKNLLEIKKYLNTSESSK